MGSTDLAKAFLLSLYMKIAEKEQPASFTIEESSEDNAPLVCDRSLEAQFLDVENELEAQFREAEDDNHTPSESALAAFVAGLPSFEAEFGSSSEESSDAGASDEGYDAPSRTTTAADLEGLDVVADGKETPENEEGRDSSKGGLIDRVRERLNTASTAVEEVAERSIARVAHQWEAADSAATEYLHAFDKKWEGFRDKSEAVRAASLSAMGEKKKAASETIQKVVGSERVQKTREHFKALNQGVGERAQKTYESLETTGKKYSGQIDMKLKDGARAARAQADLLQSRIEHVKCRTGELAKAERLMKGVDTVKATAQAAVNGFPLRRPGQARPGGA